MKIDVEINPLYEEVSAVLRSNTMNEEIEKLKNILQFYSMQLNGYKDGCMYILSYNDIHRVYSENQKVFAETNDGIYLLKMRLYEIENRLTENQFVKISRSEIVNIRYLKKVEVLYIGNMKIIFKTGKFTFVSRRFISTIKQKLDI